MICINCGKKNNDTIKFCINCGVKLDIEEFNIREKTENIKNFRRKKIYIPIIITGIIVTGMIGKKYINLDNGNIGNIQEIESPELMTNKYAKKGIYVEEINIEGAADMKGDNPIICSGETVKIKPVILNQGVKLNLEEITLNYVVEHESLLDFRIEDNVFIAKTIKPGNTDINIYYNDKIVKTLKIKIKDSEEIYNLFRSDESQYNIIDIDTSNELYRERGIDKYDIKNIIDKLQKSYDQALETGNVDLVYPYITTTGNLYESYKKNIPQWHNQGVRNEIVSASYTTTRVEGYDYNYVVGRTSVSRVKKNGKVVYEREYIEFIVTYIDGELYVDSCRNYKMLDNDFIY